MNWQIDNNNRNEVVKRFYGRGFHDLSAIPYYSLEYSRNFSPVVITNAGSIGGSGVDLANANSVKPVTRAELCELIFENGAIYIFSTKGFIKFNNRLFGKIGVYFMKKTESIDIDHKEDVEFLKRIKF